MSTFDDFFENKSESYWLEALPNYQREMINKLHAQNSYESAAELWLNASIENNSPFSTDENNKSSRNYFSLLKIEIHKLLCGNPEYNNERDQITQLIQKQENKTLIISSISACIGANVGLAASFIAPIIVIVLISITKVSLKAWCAM